MYSPDCLQCEWAGPANGGLTLPIALSISLSLYISFSLSLFLSVSVSLSLSLSVFLSLSLPLFYYLPLHFLSLYLPLFYYLPVTLSLSVSLLLTIARQKLGKCNTTSSRAGHTRQTVATIWTPVSFSAKCCVETLFWLQGASVALIAFLKPWYVVALTLVAMLKQTCR